MKLQQAKTQDGQISLSRKTISDLPQISCSLQCAMTGDLEAGQQSAHSQRRLGGARLDQCYSSSAPEPEWQLKLCKLGEKAEGEMGLVGEQVKL
jgi:hypothetical protein